jgi:hypothetical protein
MFLNGTRVIRAFNLHFYRCFVSDSKIIITNVVSSIQHYVIKFVSDLQQVSGFLRALRFPRNKTDRHDITEILLFMQWE